MEVQSLFQTGIEKEFSNENKAEIANEYFTISKHCRALRHKDGEDCPAFTNAVLLLLNLIGAVLLVRHRRLEPRVFTRILDN